MHSALLARLEAYRSRGLDGIAPYARSGGAQRSVADDLRSATRTLKTLDQLVPHAYRAMLEYPRSVAPGTEQLFRWSQIDAQGTPTLLLTHNLYIPDGDAWVTMQRIFYVSSDSNEKVCVYAAEPGAGLPARGPVREGPEQGRRPLRPARARGRSPQRAPGPVLRARTRGRSGRTPAHPPSRCRAA